MVVQSIFYEIDFEKAVWKLIFKESLSFCFLLWSSLGEIKIQIWVLFCHFFGQETPLLLERKASLSQFTKSMKKSLYLVLVLLVVVTLPFSCGGVLDHRIIKLGHAQVTNHPVHEAMLLLAERVKEKSNGKLIVKVYPNQQLGSERELVELLQIGSLGMTKVSAATMEGIPPSWQGYGMSYMFRDDEPQR